MKVKESYTSVIGSFPYCSGPLLNVIKLGLKSIDKKARPKNPKMKFRCFMIFPRDLAYLILGYTLIVIAIWRVRILLLPSICKESGVYPS